MTKSLDKFNQGIQVLHDVDVASIFSSLALGVADVQKKLDDNSIAQLSRLSSEEIAGKSLLELGFAPAFYAFDYVDISASINLKIAVSEEQSFDASIYASYEKNTNFDKEFFKRLEKSKDESLIKHVSKYKTKAVKASRSVSVELEGRTSTIHQDKGSFQMIENAKNAMRNESEFIASEAHIDDQKELEKVSQDSAVIYKTNGIVTISIPPEPFEKKQALLKMKGYPENESESDVITIDSNSQPTVTFPKGSNFISTLNNARGTSSGLVIGISGKNIYTPSNNSFASKEMSFYFDFDDYSLNEEYTFDNKPNSLSKKELKLIAHLLKNCEDLTIIIEGYTDGSGSNSYNSALSRKRIKSVVDFLNNESGVNLESNKIIEKPKGENEASSQSPDPTDRKITIHFPNGYDYIYFSDAVNNPLVTNGDLDSFCTIDPIAAAPGTVTFTYGENEYSFNITEKLLASSNVSQEENFYIERHDKHLFYLLDKESEITYFVYSTKDKEFEFKMDGKKDSEIDKEKTSIYSEESDKSKDKLKKLSTNFDGDKTFAIGGSVNVRTSRQFNMSMEGNASVSARMISMPMPDGLKLHIESLYE